MARRHNRESTFQRDLTESGGVDEAVPELAARVLQDVAAEVRPVVGLTLKVRYAAFDGTTRGRRIPETSDRDEVLDWALELA